MAADGPFLGVGWSFPPAFGGGGAAVETVSGVEDVHQSLQILLATTPGERIMQGAFGCDLHSLMFEEIDQGLINTIEGIIADGIVENEPRVDLDGVQVTRDDTQDGCLIISVSYTIRGTNSRFNMVFPFYLLEANQPGP
jgi:phage baseplate assembly protein W